MAFTYMLRCADGSYYVGSTKDLDARLWEHQSGVGARYTARRLPVELVWVEQYDRVDEAFAREKQVQGWSRKKREALISRKDADLPALSKKGFGSGFDTATSSPTQPPIQVTGG